MFRVKLRAADGSELVLVSHSVKQEKATPVCDINVSQIILTTTCTVMF